MRRLYKEAASDELCGLQLATEMECKAQRSQVKPIRQPLFHPGLDTPGKASQLVKPARAICHESAIFAEGIVTKRDSAI